MIVDRKTLLAVILADFFVMFGAAFIMWDRVELAQAHMPSIPARQAVPQAAAVPSMQPSPAANVPSPATTALGDASMNPSAAADLRTINEEEAAANAVQTTNQPSFVAQPGTGMPTRRIRFSYRNSKPNRVEIIGDFNKWQPQAMTRGKNFEWYGTFPLRPGEYTYNFIVDGKVIRDPNNARTASEGRSLLTVKPLTE